MVRLYEEHWEHHSMDMIFAATQIIAVEAKIKEWRGALAQAHLNTWFASHSCVLVPRIPRNSTLIQDARELGVSVFAQEQAACALSPSPESAPRSLFLGCSTIGRGELRKITRRTDESS